MIVEDYKKLLEANNINDLVAFLNKSVSDFADTMDDEDLFDAIEESYFANGYKILEPYLAFYYYQQKQYHLAYYFSKDSVETGNLAITYFLLSLFYLGYNHIAFDYVSNHDISSVFKSNIVPKEDLLFLSFLTKQKARIYNDDKDSVMQDLVNIQWLLEEQLEAANNAGVNLRAEVEARLPLIDNLLIITRLRILLAHYFDKNIYKTIDDDVLFKNIEKCVYDDEYCSPSFNPIKYSTYFKPACETVNYDFQDSNISLFSFSKTIGDNLTLIKTNKGSIIIDSGRSIESEKSKTDYLEFFSRCGVNLEDICLVIYTHAHLDHVGAASTLLNIINSDVPVYLTEDTKNLAMFVNGISFPAFKNVCIGETNTLYKINDHVSFMLINNGHILGSVAVLLKVGDKNIFITGDYCLHDQETVKGLDLSDLLTKCDKIDYLVTETTYGDKVIELEYKDNVIVFNNLCKLLSKYGIKTFLPAFAIGRSQEILLQYKKNKISHIHVMGLAKEVCKYYNSKLNKDFFGAGINSISDDSNIDDVISLNDIIIASSGMLAENSCSSKCYTSLMNGSWDVALIKTGYMEDKRNGGLMLDDWESSGKLLFDVSLSAHATYFELLTTINTLKPQVVICVHGNGIQQK